MGEKSASKHERHSEMAEMKRLYGDIYDAKLFVKEFRYTKEKWGAAVGTQDDLVAALGVASVEDITPDMIDNLPMFIPFAMPGIGDTRVVAVRDAYDKMREHIGQFAEVDAGEVPSTTVYGSFELGGTTVTAYLPDHEPSVWTVVVERDGERIAVETLAMDYALVFGPDVADAAALNEFIEELIKKYELE